MTAQMLSARPRFRGLSDWVAAVLMAVAAGGFVAAVGIEYRNGTATGNRPSASDFGLADAIVATVAGALGVAYVAVEVGAGRILAAMGGGRQRSNAWR